MSGRFRRLSGPGASALAVWCLEAGPAEMADALGIAPPTGAGSPRLVRVGGEDALDQGLFWVRQSAGRTWSAELHLHGGGGVAAALRRRLGERGWTEQTAAEDPDEERFLSARSPLAARAAGRARGGALEEEEQRILRLPPGDRVRAAEAWLVRAGWARVLEQPPVVALVGPPNAGKSTLFNAWLAEERVTVSPHPGTTRDAVEAGVLLGDGPEAFEIRLTDTAGLWSGATGSDAAAVEATRAASAAAWRRIWVLDAGGGEDPALEEAFRARPAGDPVLFHRHDLAPERPPGPGWLAGSVQRDPAGLLAALEGALLAGLDPPPGPDELLPFGRDRRRRLRALLGSGPGRG
jgi:small GTP-binding protein